MPGGGGYQPYARGQQRPQGPALDAMLSGRGSMGNPQDLKRTVLSQQGTEGARAPVQSEVLAKFVAMHARPSE